MSESDKSLWDKISIIGGIAIPVMIFYYGCQQNQANDIATKQEKGMAIQSHIISAENAVFGQLWEDFANEVHQKNAFEFARRYSDSIRRMYNGSEYEEHVKSVFSPLKTATDIIEKAKVEENLANDNNTKDGVTESNVRLMDSTSKHADRRKLLTFIQYSNKACIGKLSAFIKDETRNQTYHFQKLEHVVGGFKNEVRYYSTDDADKARALAAEIENVFGMKVAAKHVTWLKSSYHALELWLNDEMCK